MQTLSAKGWRCLSDIIEPSHAFVGCIYLSDGTVFMAYLELQAEQGDNDADVERI